MKITHIYHSGFLVELDHTLLLFDYYQGELPPLNPDKPLFVFVSHSHYDHYVADIWQLSQTHPCVRYVVFHDITTQRSDNILAVDYHQHYEWNGLSIDTLRSTDEGCAYAITVEGKQIYHAGDLNWWHWHGESDDFNIWQDKTFHQELESLNGRSFDVAFLPLDPRLQDTAWWGFAEFLRSCACKHVFPMHYSDNKNAVFAYLTVPQLAPFASIIHTQDQWQE